jgi:hypothetical protein
MYWKAITGGAWTTATNWATSSGNPIATWGTASTYPGSSSATYTPDDDVYLNGSNMTNAVAGLQLNLKSLSNAAFNDTKISASVQGTFIISANTTVTASNGFILGNVNANLFQYSTGATLTLTGSKFDCTAQAANTTHGVSFNGAFGANGTLNLIIDNITTPVKSDAYTISAPASSNNITINVRGNVTSSTGPFMNMGNSGTTITITGSLLANGSANLFNGTGIATFNVSGNLTSTSTGYIATYPGTNPVTIIGNVTAGTGVPAFLSTSTGLVTVYGNLTNNGIYQAVSAQRLAISSSANITLRTTDGNNTDFTPQVGGSPNYPLATDVRNTAFTNGGSTPGQVVIPSANDVRFGIPFDTGSTGLMVVPLSFDVRLGVPVNTASISGQQATGSMVVPLTSQVKQGVSVNTGSATGSYIGPADIWSYPTASLTAGIGKLIKDNLDVNVGSVSSSVMFELNKSGSQYAVVTRLQNASTVGTTGDQISSFNT